MGIQPRPEICDKHPVKGHSLFASTSLILRFYGLSRHSHFTFFKICFKKFLAAPHSMWDLSSRTRNQTQTLCIGRRNLNHWPTREAPGKLTQKESLLYIELQLVSLQLSSLI